MTKQDYILLAKAVNNAMADVVDAIGPFSTAIARRAVAESLADELEHDNPNFKRHHFLKACQVEAQ